jgi:hypothetical protein
MTESSDVVVRRVLLLPLPWRTIREHPERHATARGTLVREALVPFVAAHPPALASLQRLHRVERLHHALGLFMQASDAAARALGLDHRRALLAQDGRPLPVSFDLDLVVALGRLAPLETEALALATTALHTALDLPLYATTIRAAIGRLPALRPAEPWLAPALLRWWHVRLYELLFGPFEPPDPQDDPRRVPPEWEERVVVEAPGPRRRGADWRPSDPYLLAYLVKAWWGVHVEGESEREIARRWHARIPEAAHRRDYGANDAEARDCGCRKVVMRGLKEVAALLTDRPLAQPSLSGGSRRRDRKPRPPAGLDG